MQTSAEATADMITRLSNLKCGERLVYYTGQLAYDREGMDPISVRINKIASAAMKEAKAGHLHLVQDKVFVDPKNKGLHLYEYIAIGRRNA